MAAKSPTPPPPLPPLPFGIPLLCLLLLFPLRSNGDYYYCPTSPGCGNLTDIPYPFWIADETFVQADHLCGYPGFMLSCKDNSTPLLQIGSDNYTVLHIDNANRTISLADADVFSKSNECPRVRHNFTFLLDSVLDPYKNLLYDFNSSLEYAPSDANLTFFFNCTELLLPSNEIPCLVSHADGKKTYVFIGDPVPYHYFFQGNCSDVVVAPVLQENTHQNVSVYGQALKSGFELNWSARSYNCGECERSGGRCGVNQASNSSWVFACFCSDGTMKEYTCPVQGLDSKRKTIIGIVAGFALVFSCLLFIFILRYRKRDTKNERTVETFLLQYGSIAPKRYKYSEIKVMTKSFRDKLGQGGYGCVFKGALRDGRLVAVKLLKESKGNGEEFINEVASISRTSHVNIVSLLGFCLEGKRRALVYEFMTNGSLDKFIDADKVGIESQLDWKKLYDIAVGIARGLEYLHRGCNTRIVHFDIKPHNILLDQDFMPKISDFGLSKLCPQKESKISMTGARGTPGYIAPELVIKSIGSVSSKSDVYSYGMMLMEMVGGRKNFDAARVENTSEIYFPEWIYDNLEKNYNLGILELNVETQEITKTMIIVALRCIQIKPENRPTMSMVVDMLEGGNKDLQMPPRENIIMF